MEQRKVVGGSVVAEMSGRGAAVRAGRRPPSGTGLLSRLAEHGLRIDAASGPAGVAAATVEALVDLIPVDAAVGVSIRRGTATVLASEGLDPERFSQAGLPAEQLSAYPAIVSGRAMTGVTDVPVPVAAQRWPATSYAVAPVSVDGTVVGLLYALRRHGGSFDADDVALVSLLAARASTALERAHVLAAAEARSRRAEAMLATTQQLGASLDTGSVLDRLGNALLDVAGVDRVSVLLLDDDATHLRLASTHGTGSERFAAGFADLLARVPVRDTNTMRLVLAERRPLQIEVGSRRPSRFGRLYRQVTDAAIAVFQPLRVNDRAIGVVLLEQLAGRPPLDRAALDALEQVTASAAVALRHAELYERVERDRAQLRELHDVTLAIGTSDDLGATLQLITAAAARLTGAARCRLGLRDGDEHYRIAAVTGDTDEVGAVYPLDVAVGGWIVRTGRGVWLPDMEAGIADPPEALPFARRVEGSSLGVPLLGRDARTLGFISLHHPMPGFFPHEVVGLLERFAAEAVLAVDNNAELTARRKLERRLREAAEHDPLTGLANRALLLDRLAAAVRGRRHDDRLGLLYFDLDRFKGVNDRLGHAAGDELLVAVAQRLQAAVRPGDLVARLGGDEFVVLAERLVDPADASRLAERVLAAVAEPVPLTAETVSVGASIGVVVAGDDGRDARALLRDADRAMYRAKAGGRGRYECEPTGC